MNFVAQVEEHLRDLGTEARKNHPGVKEASERAILQLRTLQNGYVTAVRRASQTGGAYPTTALFQSQDLLRPFLLAANYPNASPQLLDVSLKGMTLLIKNNAISPGDGIHMVRVWTIQANVCAAALSSTTKGQSASVAGSSGSSWFGMLSTTSQDVSSSSGQGSLHKKDSMEKLALDLLRCLLQLLENKELDVTDEQWTASVAMSCILGNVRDTFVQQAAKTTLHQVLSILFQSNGEHAVHTWLDLLHLCTKPPSTNLNGAFAQCKSSAPSPVLCLELLHRINKANPTWLAQNVQRVEQPSIEIARALLSDKKTSSFELVWRSYALACDILTVEKQPATAKEDVSNGKDDDDATTTTRNDCQMGLIKELVHGIVRATEVCRNNHDFEDGYVYTGESVAAQKKSKPLVSLIPDSLMWRTGLALETLYMIASTSPQTVSSVAEVVSDFATVCASCRDHMLQLIEHIEAESAVSVGKDNNNHTSIRPALFRRAEEIQSAALALQKSDNPKGLQPPSIACNVGEVLWLGFHVIVRLSGEVRDESAFAPSLAVLQHFLKRFPASFEITTCTLTGYQRLAHMLSGGNSLQKKALLASLCKLSLPSWGKYDSSCQLQDHHVSALSCLLGILHRHLEGVLSEWHVVLWTLEELSALVVASQKLSNRGYQHSLSIQRVFARIAPLSTCLSDESLLLFLEALTEIVASSVEKRTFIVAEVDSDPPVGSSSDEAKKESIGGKLISFAGKALLGEKEIADDNHNHHNSNAQPTTRATKSKETYFGSYQEQFLKRMTNSKRGLRVEVGSKLSFSAMVLTDVALCNMFRFKICGGIITKHLCELSTSSSEARAFAMDALALLITTQLSDPTDVPAPLHGPSKLLSPDPPESEYLRVVVSQDGQKENDSEVVAQLDLLKPLCDAIISAQTAEVAEASISVLHSTLEDSGHTIKAGVWAVVIHALSSLSGDASQGERRAESEWSTCGMLAFRCLKLIVDDFLEQIPPTDDNANAPRKALLDCCSSFGSSRHDVNTSLTAIGLLWTIADQDADVTSIDRALSRLVLLAADTRTEVRNCSVNTLFSCVVGRGQGFTDAQWQSCICDTVFGVYQQVIGHTQTGAVANDKNSRYKVSVHHSRDSAGKQWATTLVIVIRGLCRVLRNYFDHLLETTGRMKVEVGKSATSVEEPWFVGAWRQTLDLALGAATQSGGRDTLDLRVAGVDLLVLCGQLSCQAGIQAAMTPARVGTNMEVVNGALRSVRDTSPTKQPGRRDRRNSSDRTDSCRQDLFSASFESLLRFRKHLESHDDKEESPSVYLESVHVQVLHKLAVGLAKLYECSKEDELKPSSELETSFVEFVQMITEEGKGDQAARHLTQAQRAAFELLREMVSNGSSAALDALAELGGASFFWSGNSAEQKEDESDAEAATGADILCREAAKIVSEQIHQTSIPDQSKTQLLCNVLSVFIGDSEDVRSEESNQSIEKNRSYGLLVPVLKAGLRSGSTLGEEYAGLLVLLWERIDEVVSQMIAPVQSSHVPYFAQPLDLSEIIDETVKYSPLELQGKICAIVAAGAYKALEVSRGQAEYLGRIESREKKQTVTRRRDGALRVFEACMFGLCALQPDSEVLVSISRQVFQEALNVAGQDGKQLRNETATSIDVAVLTCKAINSSSRPKPLAVAVFAQLCLLVSINHSALREEAGALLERVNIAEALSEATKRREHAEKRALEAEEENELLKIALDELREENRKLQRDIAVFSASSALT